MSRRTYDYLCQDCELRTFEIFERGEQPAHLDCPNCGGVMNEAIGAPGVLRKSYHDGYKRDGAWYLNKEAAKLESKMYELPVEKRAEAKKEISNLRKATANEKPKGGN